MDKKPENHPDDQKSEEPDSRANSVSSDAKSIDYSADALDSIEDHGDSTGSPPFDMPPRNGRVWLLITVIFLVIAVLILYVYQRGDKKTILGNQPIPAAFPAQMAQPQGVTLQPIGNQVRNVPTGGRFHTTIPNNNVTHGNNQNSLSANSTRCPVCSTTGIPLCSNCQIPMQPISALNNQLFVCPTCGKVGVPICTRCGNQMTGNPAPQTQANLLGQNSNSIGGQFHCPACGSTGLPNWTKTGTPMCPSCRAQMTTTSQQNIP